ncbi:3-coathanger stack domain-containing protein [Thiocystis violacea]|uniref:3-coathanger stack domain-containing protein n=1 Tax=Thiocystis violacea TaxID=13725 RepID=UPI0019049CD5|nr:3-coathanger stack domain-containing protein [Thiocystis violacea]
MHFDYPNPSYGHFNVLSLQNASADGVVFASPLAVVQLESNSHVLNPLTIDAMNWTLSDDVTVRGPVQLADSVLDLAGHTLTVQGDLIHAGGILTVNGGTLIVEGDYRIQHLTTDAEGQPVYEASNGWLAMQNAEDQIEVRGDFVTDSTQDHEGYLSAGTLEIMGDFTQLSTSGNPYNFYADGTHRVVLSGTGRQTVHFDYPNPSYGHFNVLEMANPSSQGVLFQSNLVVTRLFSHHGKAFTFAGTVEIPDFDGDGLRDDLDPDPLHGDDEPTSCYPSDHQISGETFQDSRLIRSEATLETGGSVLIAAGADVTFEATTRVILKPGFQVNADGRFVARISAVDCQTSAATAADTGETENEPVAEIQERFSTAEAHPLRFADLPLASLEFLMARGISADDLADLQSDAEGKYIVFSTSLGLDVGDDNELSDVYLYRPSDHDLRWISRNLDGTAATAPSDQPRIDGWGEYVVYRSASDRLTWNPDTNGVEDIFLYAIEEWSTERVSWTESGEEPTQASSHPDLAGLDLEIVYARKDENGEGAIYGYDLAVDRLTQRQDDGLCDAHHPRLSADGRYLAYLCGVPGTREEDCSVHFIDRTTGLSGMEPCPPQIEAGYRVYFDTEGGGVRWLLGPDASGDQYQFTANPVFDDAETQRQFQ